MTIKNVSTGNIAGIVLAGGRSSRMKTNKALLDFHGVPLVEHMTDMLKESGLKHIYISGDLNGYDCIPDPDSFPGPAQAIIHIIKTFKQYDGFLFVPVDMPFLTPKLLSNLMRNKKSTRYREQLLPVYLNAGHIEEHFSSVKDLLASLGVLSIPFGEQDKNCFANINTPEKWKEVVGS